MSSPVRLALLPVLVLVMLACEIAGFVIVGSEIGALATVVLVFATAVAGLYLLRLQGFGVVNSMRREMEAGRVPGHELAHGITILIAAVLLTIPGFITDLLGLLLFIRPLRELGWTLIRRRTGPPGDDPNQEWRPRRRSARIIDLDANEYGHDPGADTPRRRLDRD